MVNTNQMELSLPAKKIKKICAEAWKSKEEESILAGALNRLVGEMSATTQVISQRLWFTTIFRGIWYKP